MALPSTTEITYKAKDYVAGTVGYKYKTEVATEIAPHPDRLDAYMELLRHAPKDSVVLPVNVRAASVTYCDTPRWEHERGMEFKAGGWRRPHQHKWVIETTVMAKAFEGVAKEHVEPVKTYGVNQNLVRVIIQPTEEEWRHSLRAGNI